MPANLPTGALPALLKVSACCKTSDSRSQLSLFKFTQVPAPLFCGPWEGPYHILIPIPTISPSPIPIPSASQPSPTATPLLWAQSFYHYLVPGPCCPDCIPPNLSSLYLPMVSHFHKAGVSLVVRGTLGLALWEPDGFSSPNLVITTLRFYTGFKHRF